MTASQSFLVNAKRPTDSRVITPAGVIHFHEELEIFLHNRDRGICGTQRIHTAPVEFLFSFRTCDSSPP